MTETTISIGMISRAFIQRKQPYIWFKWNNDLNYFKILAKSFIHTIYILQRQQPVHRWKKTFVSLCTNETIEANMDTTLTITFWILVKTLSHTTCHLQRQQPVNRSKKKLRFNFVQIKHSNKHFFNWQQECFGIKDNPYNRFLITTSTGSCALRNKDICNAFYFQIKSSYLCLHDNNTKTIRRTQSTLSSTGCIIFITFNSFGTFHSSVNESVAALFNKSLYKSYWQISFAFSF